MNNHFLSPLAVIQPRKSLSPYTFPRPVGKYPYELELNEVLDLAPAVYKQRFAKGIKFHSVGDTGGENHQYRDQLIAIMEQRRRADDEIAFFYHLGDVVYEAGTDPIDRYEIRYSTQFYDSFSLERYGLRKFAIPGSHDAQQDHLLAFCHNFCNPNNLKRGVGYQPNIYWKLNTPFVNIIGLFTNIANKGHIDDDQLSWFSDMVEKCKIEYAQHQKPLIVAMYYPPFDSEDESGEGDALNSDGSPWLYYLTEKVYKTAAFYPHLVLSGHWHAYQRLTHTRINDIKTVNIIAGCGGYDSLYPIYADPTDEDKLFDGSSIKMEAKWTYKNLPNNDNPPIPSGILGYYGFLEVSVDAQKISGRFITVDNSNKDNFSIDIKTRQINKSN